MTITFGYFVMRLLVGMMFLSAWSNVIVANLVTDHLQLQDLYNALDGPNWTTQWDFLDPNHCGYPGVDCNTNDDFSVRSVDIADYSATGQLPSSFYIPSLERL